MKKIFITGITGQDGSLMADYLINNTDHTIIGGVRRLSVKNHENINHLKDNLLAISMFRFLLKVPSFLQWTGLLAPQQNYQIVDSSVHQIPHRH